MKVLYAWENSKVKFMGTRNPVISHLNLAPVNLNSIDYNYAIDGEDAFCISATAEEVKKYILPFIQSKAHSDRVKETLDGGAPGLPFLVTRSAKYIQLLNNLPWHELSGECHTRLPFVKLKETYISSLKSLTSVSINILKEQEPIEVVINRRLKGTSTGSIW